jgi:hypothetical protein
MAPAQAAAAIASQTSNTDGASTTPSGGGTTTAAGGVNTDVVAMSTSTGFEGLSTASHATSGTSGAASTGTAHTHVAGTFADAVAVQSTTGHTHPSNHSHTIPTHTHTAPAHTHITPDHAHSIPGHGHALTYGTFEEAYPSGHNVTATLYRRGDSSGVWTSMHVSTALTDDIVDLQWGPYFSGPGDYRIEVISLVGQPNGGRLGLDLYGALEVVI